MNDRFYPKPDEYDLFRLSRARTEPFLHGKKQDMRRVALATTSDVFLAFGHGRHSWYVPPGLGVRIEHSCHADCRRPCSLLIQTSYSSGR